jgi:hypothetical protein
LLFGGKAPPQMNFVLQSRKAKNALTKLKQSKENNKSQ